MYHFSYFAEYMLYGSVVLFNGLWIFGFLFVLVQVISVFFSFSAKTCWDLWIIVWIWAFFFLLACLGSFHRGNWFGPPRPNLPFWAHKLKMWICMNRSHFFNPFFENGSKWIMIKVDLIAFLYDLELRVKFFFFFWDKFDLSIWAIYPFVPCGIIKYFPNAKFG